MILSMFCYRFLSLVHRDVRARNAETARHSLRPGLDPCAVGHAQYGASGIPEPEGGPAATTTATGRPKVLQARGAMGPACADAPAAARPGCRRG